VQGKYLPTNPQEQLRVQIHNILEFEAKKIFILSVSDPDSFARSGSVIQILDLDPERIQNKDLEK